MTTAVMIGTILTIDDIFIRLTETIGTILPVDDVVEELWTAFARGNIRLVADGRQLRVEPFEGARVQRLRLAYAHRPIVEARWRVLEGRACAALRTGARPRRRRRRRSECSPA